MHEHYQVTDISRIAQTILDGLVPRGGATVIGLSGELGAGKTTLTQQIAKALGVETQLVSPTFVVAKFYETTDTRFSTLVHMDAYRIESIDELDQLGFDAIIANPQVLLIVEWPDRIKAKLPSHTQYYSIAHTKDGRYITYEKNT